MVSYGVSVNERFFKESKSQLRACIYSVLGDYPTMIRLTNTRQQRCPWCWFKRGPGGETYLKTNVQ